MGNVIGIVAEYNPFHNGHARLIEQTRARLGADCPVVCVMSGDFVQRGSPAVYSKFARAEAAARCPGRPPEVVHQDNWVYTETEGTE